MSKQSGVSSPLIVLLLLLVLSSVFPLPKLMAVGPPVQERTFKRPDPLRGFKNYVGGYNVTNKHYLSSAAFTGVHSYAIALVWLFCGLGFGIFVVFKNLRGHTSGQFRDSADHHCLLMFLVIIVFTLLAIVASGFVLAANESTLHRTKRFKGSIVKAGRDTNRTIRKVVKAMTEMQRLLRPYDPGTSMRLFTVTHLLAKGSRTIRNFVKKSGHAIDLTIQTSRILHLVVVTINLALLAASIVVLFLHWHSGFIIIIMFCWILTTLCWALAGFDFFLHIFADDTCIAFREFEQNPQNSSLSSMLTCVDPSYSDSLLAEIGSTVHNFVSELKSRVKDLYMLLGLENPNVDILGLERICDPFSGAPNYTYMPETCSKDAIPIGELPNILSMLLCERGNSAEICASEGKVIPQTFYDMAWAYSRSVQDMINIYPEVERLAKCLVVEMTFSDMVWHQCRPFRVSVRILWSSMLSLSVFMVVLVLAWVAKGFQERGGSFSRCSIGTDPR